MSGIGFASVANYALTSLATAAGVVAAQQYGTDPGGPYVSSDSLTGEALSILRKPGLESHVYMPGVGWVNGLSLTNTIMEDGSQPAVVDQPLGYVGDPIATVGPEIASATTSLTGWSAGGATPIVTSNGTSITVENGAAADAAAQVSAATVMAGRTYEITITVSEATSNGAIWVGGNRIPLGGVGTRTFRLTATSTVSPNGIRFYTNSTTLGHRLVFRDVSVKELVGAIPARQATTANKPILRRGHVNRVRNSTMQGAVAGSPGTLPTNWNTGLPAGITRTVVGVGVVDGLSYIDVRFFGTASATAGLVLDPEAVYSTNLAVSGQTWTFAASLALVGGSWPIRLVAIEIFERNSSNTLLASTPLDIRSVVTGPTLTKASVTRTLNQATTAGVTCGVVRCGIQAGDVIDFTLRIAAPQLEQGSVANIFVPTATAFASSPAGPYWAEFDGTDFLSLAAVPFQQADDHCVVTCLQPTNLTSPTTSFSIRSSVSANPIVCSIRADAANNRIRAAYRDDAGTLVFVEGPTGLVLGTRYVSSARRVSGTAVVRTNSVAGTPTSIAALGATTVNGAAIGVEPLGTPTQHFIGSIYPVIAIKGTVSDADLAILERFVAQASGVQL